MIEKKLITLAVLAAVLVAVGVFYYVDKGKVEQAAKEEEAAKDLFAFKPEDVTRVKVERAGETVVAERSGEDSWEVVEPYDAAGDKAAFRNLVSGIANGKLQQNVGEVEDLAKYGLATPEITVTLGIKDSTAEYSIFFGNQIPSGADYFARRGGGDDVITVLSYVRANADKSLFDFLDKSLLDFDVNDVKSYEVIGNNVTLAVEIPDKNRARMLQPYEIHGDYSKINGILWKVKNAKVARFGPRDVKDSELALYGLVNPATKVVLGFGEEGSDRSYKALDIGDATREEGKTRYWAKRERDNDLFLIEESSVKDMFADPDSLRASKLVQIREWDADYLEIRRHGETVSLEKDADGNWKMTSPEKYPGKDEGVRGVIGKFAGYDGFKIDDYIMNATDMVRYHLDPAPYHLTVRDEDLEDSVSISEVILENVAGGNSVRRVYARWDDYPDTVLVMQETKPIIDALETDLAKLVEMPTPTPTVAPPAAPTSPPAPAPPEGGSVEEGGKAPEPGAMAPVPAEATGETGPSGG